ncbi:MAG: site-specific DNA-methyltransferase [Candidatus Aenigmarchaeota archaeon]|nr:site-specific DNA-methyltransferase [Candidatus Aenigmarchaeota archaeon]
MYRSKIELHNVDCLPFMKQCEDKQFDLAIVDPPYGIGEDGKKNHSRGKATKPTFYKPKEWDKKTPEEIYFLELKRVSKNQIIWGANHFIEKIPKANSSSWVVWDKLNGVNDFADCELALTNFKKAVRKYTFRWAGMLQGDMKNKEIRIHPTQKPVKLYEWLLINYAKEGDKILDTHLGSGSIAIACYNYKFDLVACELDKEYFEAAIKRLEQHKKQLTLF